MITFDGHRSMLRRPFAQKKLAQIKVIGVPSKAIKWDGFTFKVWQQDELSGGRITAPMGAAVIMSTWDGMFIATADYWRGAWSGARPLHALYKAIPDNATEFYALNTRDSAAMADAGFSTLPMEPQLVYFFYGLPDDYSDTEYLYDAGWSALPGLMPWGLTEKFRVTFADQLYHLFPDESSLLRKQVFETRSGMYYDTGERLIRVGTYAKQTGNLTSAQDYWMMAQWLDKNRMAQHFYSVFTQAAGEKIVLTNLTVGDDGTVSSTVLPLSSMIIPELVSSGNMPSALRDLLLATETGQPVSCTPVGTYSFLTRTGAQATLLVINATSDFLWGSENKSSPLYEYFEDHPEDAKWKLFYVLRIGVAVYVVNSNQFIGLLDSLASNITVIGTGGSVNWVNALRVLRRITMVWPLQKNYVPYDSALFHDSYGNIVSWSREWGAIAITPSGMFDANAEVWMPIEVTAEEGVRPEISVSSQDGAADTFVCICRKVVEKRIRQVYVGTPFEENKWIPVPGPPSGFALVHVRPVRASSLADSFFIGVVYGQKEGASAPGYYFASIHVQWDGDPLTYDTLPPWSIHGRLPFNDATVASFQVGLFGNDERVTDMANYPDHQPVTPQLPTCPVYSYYANGMP